MTQPAYHQESYPEFIARLSRNRKANIAACQDPMKRAQLIRIDQAWDETENACRLIDMKIGEMK